MDDFKFHELTFLQGIVEQQIIIFEKIIEGEQNEDRKAFLKNEMSQFKSQNTKLKKLIKNY